jgi:hypothetical protein
MSLCPHCRQNHAAVGAVPQASPYRSQVQRIYAAAIAEQAQHGLTARPSSFHVQQQLKAKKAASVIQAQQQKERAAVNGLMAGAATGAPFLFNARRFRLNLTAPSGGSSTPSTPPTPPSAIALPALDKPIAPGATVFALYQTPSDIALRSVTITSPGLQVSSVKVGRNEALPTLDASGRTGTYDACSATPIGVPAANDGVCRGIQLDTGGMVWTKNLPMGATINSNHLYIVFHNATGAAIMPTGFVS